MRRCLVVLASALVLGGCTTYRHLKKVKLVSFVPTPANGKSVGKMSGEDCQWVILGNPIAEASISRAITKAASGSTDLEKKSDRVDYLRNVHSTYDVSNFVLFQKNCYVVSGVGYKIRRK